MICFKKSIGYMILLGLFLVLFIAVTIGMSQKTTSTSARAEGTNKCERRTCGDNLVFYFNFNDLRYYKYATCVGAVVAEKGRLDDYCNPNRSNRTPTLAPNNSLNAQTNISIPLCTSASGTYSSTYSESSCNNTCIFYQTCTSCRVRLYPYGTTIANGVITMPNGSTPADITYITKYTCKP